MKIFIKKRLKNLVTVFAIAGFISSCNKDLPEAEPINPPAPTGSSIMETLNDPNFTFLKAAVTRASTATSPTGNLSALLSNKEGVFTFFAPDDNAFKASLAALGMPADIASINFFRPGQLDTIIKYHLVGGEKITSGKVTPTK